MGYVIQVWKAAKHLGWIGVACDPWYDVVAFTDATRFERVIDATVFASNFRVEQGMYFVVVPTNEVTT